MKPSCLCFPHQLTLLKITIMNRSLFYQISCITLLLVSSVACVREDVGPYQNDKQTYALTNFDRLDMGSAFGITVRQGANFSIVAEGDQRNLNDLDVYTRNGTLFAQYRNHNRSRQYQTSFQITMPTLRGVSFSGASQSEVSGCRSLNDLDIELSGASKGKFEVQASRTTIDLSGASKLDAIGSGTALTAGLSGASKLDAFGYPVDEARVNASGASNARISVTDALVADASGASAIRYRGTPRVQQRVSGSSTVQSE
jgi:hypothetical protein